MLGRVRRGGGAYAPHDANDRTIRAKAWRREGQPAPTCLVSALLLAVPTLASGAGKGRGQRLGRAGGGMQGQVGRAGGVPVAARQNAQHLPALVRA